MAARPTFRHALARWVRPTAASPSAATGVSRMRARPTEEEFRSSFAVGGRRPRQRSIAGLARVGGCGLGVVRSPLRGFSGSVGSRSSSVCVSGRIDWKVFPHTGPPVRGGRLATIARDQRQPRRTRCKQGRARQSSHDPYRLHIRLRNGLAAEGARGIAPFDVPSTRWAKGERRAHDRTHGLIVLQFSPERQEPWASRSPFRT